MPLPARGGDRYPAVAGTFYPAHRAVLARTVDDLLTQARGGSARPSEPAPRAILVPHAGYIYSGPTAAEAFTAVADTPERVILVGPAHRVGFDGLSAADVAHYRVPTGAAPVDREAIADLEAAGLARFVPEAHADEHCLEVMIPFLLACFGEVPILPLLVGYTSPGQVEAILAHVLRPRDLLLISSDLSHFHPYDDARARDLATLDAVARRAWQGIGPHDACGHMGLSGALRLATARDWDVDILDYRNSGDTAGDRRRVVGYGAAAFRPRA